MAINRWKMKNIPVKATDSLVSDSGLDKITARLLLARGIETTEEAELFLSGFGTLSDPFELKDMDLAADRIKQAIAEDQCIAIFGDYDADGITATAILYKYLKNSGCNNISYYIPSRESEGYGMSIGALDKLIDNGVQLIITVDNGITAIEQSEYLEQKGVDLVVTDHHKPLEQLPHAAAVVNPHRKDGTIGFKDLCGAGVALKLICALEDGDTEFAPLEYFDLAAIGTVADIMPLTGENRTIVKNGLESILGGDCNVGISALLMEAGAESTPDAQTLGFIIAPRLNAAGRMDHAKHALELLLCEDMQTARKMAANLCNFNNLRQKTEQVVLEEAEQLLAENPEKLKEPVLILSKEGWHQGVLGIVSARLIEKYQKPAVVLSIENNIAKGSARGYGDCSVYDILSAASDLYIAFGGHKDAAGLSLPAEKIKDFEKRMYASAKEMNIKSQAAVVEIDLRLFSSQIQIETVQRISKLEPFGKENPRPQFLIENCRIEEIYKLSQGKHTKLKLSSGNDTFQAVYFKMPTGSFPMCKGSYIDIVALLSINEYNGKESVSIQIKDARPSGFNQDKYFSEKEVYEHFCAGEEIGLDSIGFIQPARDELGVVFKLIKSGGEMSLEQIYFNLFETFNYCKLCLITDILCEIGVIDINGGLYSAAEKTGSLEQSKILQKLNAIS